MASAFVDMLPEVRGDTVQLSVAGAVAVLFLYYVGSFLRSPLRRYPGPFLAKFTNLWRMYRIIKKSFPTELHDLHKKYGPVVRVGPNVLDVDYPELIKTVFNTKGDWRKTESVCSSSVLVQGKIVHNLFSQLDPDIHAFQKRPIAKFYSPTGVAPVEPLVDRTIRDLCSQLEQRFMTGEAAGKPFDLGAWALYYAWDVVGTATFSEPLGYLEHGCDFDGTLRISEQAIDYFSAVYSLPSLDLWLDKNPVMHVGPPGFNNAAKTAVGRLVARYQGTDSAHHSAAQPDYLDHFLAAKARDPEAVDDNQIVSWLLINVIAGSDTTAIVIRSALYFSLRTPAVWARLRDELAAAGCTPDRCPLPYKVVRSLPYLEAIVREALRFHPGVALSLERYVPEGGQRLPDGTFVPGGSILAFNAYVICRNKQIFGEDADEFRPERWLRGKGESEEAYAQRLQAMNNADLTFGGGSRVCLGQHFALLQVYKLVATLAVLYDFEVTSKEWKVVGSWFPRQEGFMAAMSKR